MLSPTASAVDVVEELLLFEMAWRASFVMEVVRLCRCCMVIRLLVCCDFEFLHLVVDGMSSSAPRRISEHDRWGSIILVLSYYILSPCFIYAVAYCLGCVALYDDSLSLSGRG